MNRGSALKLVPGQTIRFVGGTGRGDEDKVLEGIVNGRPKYAGRQRFVFVPTYLRDTDQIVMVDSGNIATAFPVCTS